MPIYEYECTECQHQFDLMQKISDPPAKQCPQCLNNTVIRLVSPAGFQLKGTGWYVTDFKNKGKPETAAKPSEAKAAEKSSTDKTSDSTSKKEGKKD